MIYAIFAGVIIILALLAVLMQRYTHLEFVAHVKVLWRAWSVRLSVLSVLLAATAQEFPQYAITAWNSLPPDVKALLPPDWLHYISMGLVVLAVFAQIFRQPRMRRDDDSSDRQ